MPLPSGGAWPPPALAPVHTKLAEWSAWYSGEPDALAAIYGGQTGAGDTTGFFASERGGVRGRVRRAVERWFWGTQPTAEQPRTKLHVPLASDIAATSATLVFPEPITITTDDDTTNKRLEELAEYGLHSTLIEGAELCGGLGGVYPRVCWDPEVADGPWLSMVHADAAVPEYSWGGRLTAVTFWEILADDGQKVIRHLERHEKGAILHGLYEGDRDTLGHMIPLTEAPETADLAVQVNEMGAIETGIKLLKASYVPNMRPNRIWRNTPAAAHLGRSDLQGIESVLDALDEVYSSWRRDIRIGVGRIFVPDTYLESQGRGKGALFDIDLEVLRGLNVMEEGQASMQLHAAQFEIRFEAHQRTAQDLMNHAVRGAGYSAQTFGEQGEVAMTATEAQVRKNRSDTTKGRKIAYWDMGLGDALHALLAIDKAKFNSRVTVARPRLEWPDGTVPDPKTLAETLNMLRQAQAASTQVLVAMLHPDWEDTEVQEEADRIQKEVGEPIEDPLAVRPPGADSDPDAPPAGGQPFPNRQ
jgi:A118 family predicted phage portal protein